MSIQFAPSPKHSLACWCVVTTARAAQLLMLCFARCQYSVSARLQIAGSAAELFGLVRCDWRVRCPCYSRPAERTVVDGGEGSTHNLCGVLGRASADNSEPLLCRNIMYCNARIWDCSHHHDAEIGRIGRPCHCWRRVRSFCLQASLLAQFALAPSFALATLLRPLVCLLASRSADFYRYLSSC